MVVLVSFCCLNNAISFFSDPIKCIIHSLHILTSIVYAPYSRIPAVTIEVSFLPSSSDKFQSHSLSSIPAVAYIDNIPSFLLGCRLIGVISVSAAA